jgi:hypothetical protein
MVQKQDKKCTYNVTLRFVLATIVTMEKKIIIPYCKCVCRLSYPACGAYAPYYQLWPAQLHNIFPHYYINGTIFENNFIERKMCVLIFSTKF